MPRELALSLLLATAAPCVAAEADQEIVRKAILSLVPGATINSIAESKAPNLYEVVVGGQIVYVSHDGQFLFQGMLLDIANNVDLTELRRAKIRAEGLAGVGPDRRIIFSPEKSRLKHAVTVFTDIDCGYCRRLHQQVAEYNQLGIAIEYLFFPRAGIGSESFDKAVTVWCSDDRRKAMTDAKAGVALDKKECANPIEADYALGNQLGIGGTPAIIAKDGSQLGGYVPPEQLLQRLDQLAEQRLAAKK